VTDVAAAVAGMSLARRRKCSREGASEPSTSESSAPSIRRSRASALASTPASPGTETGGGSRPEGNGFSTCEKCTIGVCMQRACVRSELRIDEHEFRAYEVGSRSHLIQDYCLPIGCPAPARCDRRERRGGRRLADARQGLLLHPAFYAGNRPKRGLDQPRWRLIASQRSVSSSTPAMSPSSSEEATRSGQARVSWFGFMLPRRVPSD
jgi:hypothetical protein